MTQNKELKNGKIIIENEKGMCLGSYPQLHFLNDGVSSRQQIRPDEICDKEHAVSKRYLDVV